LFVRSPQRKRFDAKALARGFSASDAQSLFQAVGALGKEFRIFRSGCRRKFAKVFHAEIDGFQVWSCTLSYEIPGRKGAFTFNRLLFVVFKNVAPVDIPYLCFKNGCVIHREFDLVSRSYIESHLIRFVPEAGGTALDTLTKQGKFETYSNLQSEASEALSLETLDRLLEMKDGYCIECMMNGIIVAYNLDNGWPLRIGDKFEEFLKLPLDIAAAILRRR